MRIRAVRTPSPTPPPSAGVCSAWAGDASPIQLRLEPAPTLFRSTGEATYLRGDNRDWSYCCVAGRKRLELYVWQRPCLAPWERRCKHAVVEGRNERMKMYIYRRKKKNPHKTLRVHSARYTQCVHVSSCKLKTSKDTHTNKVQPAPTHRLLPKSK